MDKEKLDLILKLKRYIIDIINSDNQSFYLLYAEIKLFLHSNKQFSALLYNFTNMYLEQLSDLNYKKYIKSLIFSVNAINKHLGKSFIDKGLTQFDDNNINLPFNYFLHPGIVKLHKLFLSKFNIQEQLEFIGPYGLFFYYNCVFEPLYKYIEDKGNIKKYKGLFQFARRCKYIQSLSIDKNWVCEDFMLFELCSEFEDLHKGQNRLFLLKIVVISVLYQTIKFITEGCYDEFANTNKGENLDFTQKKKELFEKLDKNAFNFSRTEQQVIDYTNDGLEEKEMGDVIGISISGVKHAKQRTKEKIFSKYPNFVDIKKFKDLAKFFK